MEPKAYRRQLRKELTPAERKLWQALRAKRFLNIKVRRQHTIDKYIVDFYCPASKLVIELDGEVHADTGQQQYDSERNHTLNAMGYRVIRFPNQQVFLSLDSVLIKIEELIFDK
jgi:very-short-patch-repair endonuclease